MWHTVAIAGLFCVVETNNESVLSYFARKGFLKVH